MSLLVFFLLALSGVLCSYLLFIDKVPGMGQWFHWGEEEEIPIHQHECARPVNKKRVMSHFTRDAIKSHILYIGKFVYPEV